MADPYPHFAELRERAAVVYLEQLDAWAITRYEPIREALGDPASYSSSRVAFNEPMNQAIAGTSLATDPPDHQQLRAALTRNLSPRALRGLKDRIDEQADGIVAALVERGSFDAMDDLARALPLAVVIDLIGIRDPQIRANILTWGEAAFDCLGPMNERAGQAFEVAGQFFAWVQGVTAADLREGSMGHGIFLAAERGDIPREAAPAIIHQYIAAGMDTTIAAIGNAVWLLANHPPQWDVLRANPELVPSAFNEVLRYVSPVHAWGRHVTDDIEIDGTVIPAGAQAALLFGAGNRDGRHYDEPDSFLVERNPVDHLSFGYGPHTCAGQGLARLEGQAALAVLVRRFRRIEVGEPERRITNMTRTFEKLPVLNVEPV